MKKRLSLLLAAMLVLASLFCVVFSVTASAAPETVATFTLGANGSAVHADGSEKSTYSETVNGYTLSITGGTKMYTGARDAKGNSCIKLGTSSAIGSFSFTAPSDVTEVVIYAAKYKAKTSKITINGGTAKTLSNSSDNGAYDVITIDTSVNKTVKVATVSGSTRAMINTIEFKKEAAAGACEHDWVSEGSTATCDKAGTESFVCSKCNEEKTADVAALGHNYSEVISDTDSTCVVPGVTETACSRCDDVKEEVKALAAHNYVDGKCSVCEKKAPTAVFEFGSNDSTPDASEGSASDGSDIGASKSFTDGDYTLAISGATKVYSGAYDALGNSCLKLGTGSVAAQFTITVPDDIGKVVVYIAGYKANKAIISINGENYTITTLSTNGQYTAIEIDTTENKEVTFVTMEGGYRAKINAIEFYKADAPVEPEIPEVEEPAFDKASLEANVDLTVNYKVVLPAGDDIANYFVVFEMNGKYVTVREYTEDNGMYVFAFKGIAPQMIADEINAYLYADDSEDVIAEKLGFSVVKYAEAFVAAYGEDESMADLKACLASIIEYGNAAKAYVNYKADEDIVVDGLVADVLAPSADDSVRDVTDSANAAVGFVSAGVRYDFVNKIFVKFEVTDPELAVTLYVNGAPVVADLVGSNYVYYTDGIAAADFDKTFTFELKVGDATVQTFTYSVNSYAVAMINSANVNTQNLVKALYTFGKAAEKATK